MKGSNKRKGHNPSRRVRKFDRTQDSDKSSEVVKDTESNNTFGGNSIEWFSRYPNLLLAAGSIPYPYKPGMVLPLGKIKSTPEQSEPKSINMPLPGIISFDWQPTVGFSDSQTSPISIVGKEVYAKVREKFSGSLDADAPDFVVYLMALDSIFSYIAKLKSIYRTLNAYSPENLFTPTGILRGMGLPDAAIEGLRANKMEFYQRINELVLMTRKFKCPRIMDVFNRHVWLNDHVYTDAPTIKSQFYIFNQYAFYRYSLVKVPGSDPEVSAGGLIPLSLYPIRETDTVQYLFEFGRRLIDALAGSDDGYLISGYLMRAYEGVPEFYVDELLLGETLIPKYNEEVLSEIENLHTIPGGATSILNTVAQDPATNSIICHPTAVYPASGTTCQFRLDGILPRFNSRSDNPTTAETTIASRLMSYIQPLSIVGDTGTARITCCSEIVVGINLVHYKKSGQINFKTYVSEVMFDLFNDATQEECELLALLMQSTQWDWAPMVYVNITGQGATQDVLLGDIHNVTTTTMETLNNLNRVCLYSLFNAFSV